MHTGKLGFPEEKRWDMAAETWQFYKQQATNPIHNPISGEFFSTEAVGDVTEAIIREGMQNTLDARQEKPDGKRQTAHARIFLSELEAALPPSDAQRWFKPLWPHITAPDNGLRNQPAADQPCHYLVFEDFGTIGLKGDPQEFRLHERVANHFLNFFRAEGHSDKGGDDRGSWGVGKTVFPRASRIGSFFGLTRRADDGRRLLLGRSILKYHRVNGEPYTSDGYFGLSRKDGFMLPTENASTIDRFCDDFNIKRKDDSGLSIVVPWYENGGDGVTREKVIAAVLKGFFYPILRGSLEVTVATPSGEISLHANTIIETLGHMDSEFLPLVKMAEWAWTHPPSEFLSLLPPPPERAQTWSADLVPPEVVLKIRQALAQRQGIALRIPIHVQLRGGDPVKTFFDVFMEHSEQDSEKPVFIRDDLIIPKVTSPRVSQVRSLVIVEQPPLATLLRDAETPAHTYWDSGTGNFKDKYLKGTGVITFVSRSVSELLRIVNQAEQQPDPTITIDFFSVPAPPDDDDTVPGRRRKSRPAPGGGPTPPTEPPPTVTPRRFRIEKLAGGFGIRPGQPGAPLPPFIDISVAYDIRKGNPLRKYHPADFDLGREPIRQAANAGLSVSSAEGNRMLVAIGEPDFLLDVTGFDADRDLYVKAVVKEAADVDQAD